MLSKLDKKIISLISRDIPLVKEPFKKMACKIGIEERALLSRIKSYKKKGIMRKFCASLNHNKIGFRYNAMVAWNVALAQVSKAGNLMASFTQVSHCYERKKAPDWNYNLYSMIHGRTREQCFNVIRQISKETSCKDYRILFSSKEFKKSAVKY